LEGGSENGDARVGCGADGQGVGSGYSGWPSDFSSLFVVQLRVRVFLQAYLRHSLLSSSPFLLLPFSFTSLPFFPYPLLSLLHVLSVAICVNKLMLIKKPETMVLKDGPLKDWPWGCFEELTHVLRLFSLVNYVLMIILAILVVWRRFHLDIFRFLVVFLSGKSSRVSRQNEFDRFTPVFVEWSLTIMALSFYMKQNGLIVVLNSAMYIAGAELVPFVPLRTGA
jgi:hypothetical protein